MYNQRVYLETAVVMEQGWKRNFCYLEESKLLCSGRSLSGAGRDQNEIWFDSVSQLGFGSSNATTSSFDCPTVSDLTNLP